jgi:MFS family permease
MRSYSQNWRRVAVADRVEETSEGGIGAALGRTFRSLSIRNYRLFFGAQVISWTGTWIQWVGQAWLVLRLTHSGFALGLTTAFQWLPVLLFGAWGGVLADRFPKRMLLLATNGIAGVLALVLGLATVAGAVSLWLIMLVAFVLGIVTAVDNPTRQAFTLEMVGAEQVPNAVSLNTLVFTVARVLGPALAGILIGTIGIGPCFLINAASFVPVLIALWAMRGSELQTSERVARARGQIREGIRYVNSVPILRTLLLMMAVVGTLTYNFHVILPLLARFTFHGGARVYGILSAFLGVGMLIGSLVSASRKHPTLRFLLGSGLSLGFFILVASLVPTYPLELVAMIPLGASSMAFVATLNATLQLNSSDAMRGRVMALYFVLFLGSTPVGAPIIGWISQQFNPRVALGVGAIATLGSCAWAWSRLRSEWSPHSGAGSDELPEGSFEDRDERLLQEHA